MLAWESGRDVCWAVSEGKLDKKAARQDEVAGWETGSGNCLKGEVDGSDIITECLRFATLEPGDVQA